MKKKNKKMLIGIALVALLVYLFYPYLTAAKPGTECYQEQANIATNCGGLSTGTYENYYGDNALIDGNWDTRTVYDALSEAYINYTKPRYAVSSVWTIGGSHYTSSIIIRNVTIPNSCWNAYPSKIRLKVQSVANPVGNSIWSCWNGTSWTDLYSFNGGDNCRFVFEEAMIWRF